jgi:hypothetical protein
MQDTRYTYDRRRGTFREECILDPPSGKRETITTQLFGNVTDAAIYNLSSRWDTRGLAALGCRRLK